jgi:hypothetical protein
VNKAPFNVSLFGVFIYPFAPNGQSPGCNRYHDNKRARIAQEELPQLITVVGIKNIGGQFMINRLNDS